MSHTVDINGAADLMKVHPKTVADLIHAGAIPAAKVGRSWVMLTRDVIAHIENAISMQTAQRLGRSMRRMPPHQSRSARSDPRRLA
jgi:excisionase family DNA binding protein